MSQWDYKQNISWYNLYCSITYHTTMFVKNNAGSCINFILLGENKATGCPKSKQIVVGGGGVLRKAVCVLHLLKRGSLRIKTVTWGRYENSSNIFHFTKNNLIQSLHYVNLKHTFNTFTKSRRFSPERWRVPLGYVFQKKVMQCFIWTNISFCFMV
jgi:hypothetical protein